MDSKLLKVSLLKWLKFGLKPQTKSNGKYGLIWFELVFWMESKHDWMPPLLSSSIETS